MENRSIRFGILGAARIAPLALIRPARDIEGVEVRAVASRDKEKAVKFAGKHGVDKVHENYEALINDPDIDAIYNPLPNSLHCRWTVHALEAGKHVLCEKPLASNAEEAEMMQDTAQRSGRILATAFHWRYHPLARRIREIVEGGEIGSVRRIEASFCVPMIEFKNIRWRYELGGGAMMDLGCYGVSFLQHLADGEPRIVAARAKLSRPRVDRYMEAEVAFPDGITGSIRASLLSRRLLAVEAEVTGDTGSLHVTNFALPQYFHSLKVKTSNGKRTEKMPDTPTYNYQLEAFRDWVNGGPAMETGASYGVENMRIIDDVYRAAGLPIRGEPV